MCYCFVFFRDSVNSIQSLEANLDLDNQVINDTALCYVENV